MCCAKQASKGDWLHADSDELRRKMADVVGRAARPGSNTAGRVVLDRLHLEKSERAKWLAIAHAPSPSNAMAVVFDVDVEECVERVASRVGHPTIPAGSGETVVRSWARKWDVPGADDVGAWREEGFGRVEFIRTPQEAARLLARLGAGEAADCGSKLVRTRSSEERRRRQAAEGQTQIVEQGIASMDAELAKVRVAIATEKSR